MSIDSQVTWRGDTETYNSPFAGLSAISEPESSSSEQIAPESAESPFEGIYFTESPFSEETYSEADEESTAIRDFLEALHDEDFEDALEQLLNEGAARALADAQQWSAPPSEVEAREALEVWIAPLISEWERAVDGFAGRTRTHRPCRDRRPGTRRAARLVGEPGDPRIRGVRQLHRQAGEKGESGSPADGSTGQGFRQEPGQGRRGYREKRTEDPHVGGQVPPQQGARRGEAGRIGVPQGRCQGAERAVDAYPAGFGAATRPAPDEASRRWRGLRRRSEPIRRGLDDETGVAAELAEAFDYELAALAFATEADEELAEEVEEFDEDSTEHQLVADLDDARARLATQLSEYTGSGAPIAEIEQFVPAVLAIRPLLKLGLTVTGAREQADQPHRDTGRQPDQENDRSRGIEDDLDRGGPGARKDDRARGR